MEESAWNVKSSMQPTKFCLKTKIDSLEERFYKLYLRQDFGFLSFWKQTPGASKKMEQNNHLFDNE